MWVVRVDVAIHDVRQGLRDEACCPHPSPLQIQQLWRGRKSVPRAFAQHHLQGVNDRAAEGLSDGVVDGQDVIHRCHASPLQGAEQLQLERELKPIDLEMPALGGGAPVSVRVEDLACSRYLGLAIDGAVNGVSPDWLRELLLAVGQRPIDLLVDLSNFVMLDLGQPNHAFDRDRLASDGIVVRKASAGERMTTLDGEERELVESDLLITSGGDPVALAGVMGGEGSKVGDETGRLLLECATFDATTVRRTSARLAQCRLILSASSAGWWSP